MSPPAVLLVAACELPAGDEWLGASERAALTRLRAPKRRRDFRLGRFAAKRALVLVEGGDEARELGRFEVRAAPGGAPLAFHDGAPLASVLSISHSNGRAAAAVHRGSEPLGCDLEHVEARSRAFLEDYFTSDERAFVAAGSQDEVPARATLVWSAKEAVMKALGQGLRLPPTAVAVLPALGPVSVGGWRAFSILAPSPATRLRGWWRVMGEFVLTLVGGREEPRIEGAVPWP